MSLDTVDFDLRAACRAKLLAGIAADTGNLLPEADQIDFEGEPFETFTPTIGTPWISERVVSVDDKPASLGLTAVERFFNLTLSYPAGKGTKRLELAVGALRRIFIVGSGVAHGSNSGTVMQVRKRDLETDGAWLSALVMIKILAYTGD